MKRYYVKIVYTFFLNDVKVCDYDKYRTNRWVHNFTARDSRKFYLLCPYWSADNFVIRNVQGISVFYEIITWRLYTTRGARILLLAYDCTNAVVAGRFFSNGRRWWVRNSQKTTEDETHVYFTLQCFYPLPDLSHSKWDEKIVYNKKSRKRTGFGHSGSCDRVCPRPHTTLETLESA